MTDSLVNPSPEGNAPVIMHISESLGGGVATSISSMITALPEYRHVVIAIPLRGHYGQDPQFPMGTELYVRDSRRVFRVRRYARRMIQAFDPMVVHLHSSIAGAVGRSITQNGRRVVYTPHCFAFERLDISPVIRRITMYIERLLSHRLSAYVVVSRHEGSLARSLNGKIPTYVAINVPAPSTRVDLTTRSDSSHKPIVASLGRASKQKDPEYFLRVVKASRALGVEAKFLWIGTGDLQFVSALSYAGVEVSGWLPHAEALTRLAAADLYLHTAAWEAMPMGVLEAAALGLPVVLRKIAALEELEFALHTETPGATAETIQRLLAAPALQTQVSTEGRAWIQRNANMRGLREALREAYGFAK